ncbi:trypsin-like serine peptidase [Nonomuraea sp. NPDC059194]|uniref:trypsin-like serine peptidase n=1 Tax=Nonomuraea sp. NPDC059194 TaxID=3346764 RepID=UPI0036CA42CE
MTSSLPLLASAPLVAGLMGAALLGATPIHPVPKQHAPKQDVAAPVRPADVVEHAAARGSHEQRRVLDYWTPLRMSRALPIDLLGTVTKSGLTRSGPAKSGPATGGLLKDGLTGSGLTKDGLIKDELVKGGKDGGLLSGLGSRTGLGIAPELAGATGKVATPRRQAARPAATTSGSRWMTGGAVTRTTGRVFLTMDGVDFVCSASTVKSANRDVVVTAGHCVKDGKGSWAANWTFVPGYESGGGRPYGTFTARRMFVAGPWSRSADDSYDVGMVALNTSGGEHVADVVGFQDIVFNPSRGGQMYGFGYPADPPFDGERLIYCAGRVGDDPHGQTRDQGLRCDMTAGSSGGPWMSDFDAVTGRGTVSSVSSFKYSDDRATMYGPYFGDSAKALFATAERA